MREIIWSGAAERDLLSIALHYDTVDPTVGERILDRIERASLPLLDYPRLGEATLRPNTRKWPAKGTPYLLFYGIAGDRIEIKRVRHVAEDWRPA